MALVRWDPGSEVDTLQTEMNRVFDAFFGSRPGNGGHAQRWVPAMDLVEDKNDVVLQADLPGLSEDDVNIEVKDGVLTISGERKTEEKKEEEGYYRVERAFGSFSRSLTPPRRDRPRPGQGRVRQRRARGADPEAGGAQAAPRRDRQGQRRGRGHREEEVAQPDRRMPTSPLPAGSFAVATPVR